MIRHRHLPTKRLNVSPTAIERISGGEPGLSFERAIRLPPARNLETTKGTFPDARRFTISLSEEQIVFCNAVFSRCWICNLDGPHAVAFGKDLKTDNWWKDRGGCQMSHCEGLQEAAFGCFVFNNCNCQVVSLLGAIPEEFKTWQALPYKPFFACLMADWMLKSEPFVWVWNALDDSC